MNKSGNLILIGMPGSGKSTCRVLAAKALCKSFLDTDLLIQTREGMSLQDLINRNGPEYFARAEENALLSIGNGTEPYALEEGNAFLNIRKGAEPYALEEGNAFLNIQQPGYVIATGGSAVYYEKAMDHLRKDGIVIYLQISFPVMQERITNITTRGILLHPGESLEEMFHAREALYRKYADITIDCDQLTIEQTVAAICSH